MRNRLTSALFHIVMGLGIAIGPYTLFPVCDISEKIMKCWWSVKAETAIGMLVIFAGIFNLILKRKEAFLAVSFNNIAVGVVAILIPSKLIGGCVKEIMPCRSLTFPAVYIISLIIIFFNIGSIK